MIYIVIQGKLKPGAEAIYEKYLNSVAPLMKEYGSEVVLVGAGIESEFASDTHEHNAVLSMPSEEAVQNFLGDPRYLEIKKKYRDESYEYLNLTIVRGRPPRKVD